jgi:branched-chain amino acid transport system permease protein
MDAEDPGPEQPAAPAPRIGADEWVASVEARRAAGGGLIGELRRRLDQLPAPVAFAGFVVLAALLPQLTSNGYIIVVGFNTLYYMLLALGLNIVVGFAGLLDLGYVAFFGAGAYGYAMLASSQFHIHWPTIAILPVVTIACAALGVLVALPSRRLVGDYLAIVTLFFGQLFVTVTNNGESMSLLGLTRDVNVTNGPNGIANIDPFRLFGHSLESLSSYFYVALAFFVVVLGVVYLVSNSRTGRAWRSLREDPLAAELMGMPTNRLKLQAFAFGAAVAGLTGTLFASQQSAVFSSDFDTPTLIIVYAMLILGGAGSLGGVIVGAIVVNASLEVLRTPNHATLVFFILIAGTLLSKLRPWRTLAGVLAGTLVLGFAFRELVGAIWPFALHAQGAVNGSLGRLLGDWLPVSPNYQVGNDAFCLLVALVLVLTTVRPHWRTLLLAPALVLASYDWDSRLAFEPSITRQIFVGVILIVLMNARPEGLLGSARVEVV